MGRGGNTRTAQRGTGLWLLSQPHKTWLVTNEECLTEAMAAFKDTNINITGTGRPYLGAALGVPSYVDKYLTEKVEHSPLSYSYHTATCCICSVYPWTFEQVVLFVSHSTKSK